MRLPRNDDDNDDDNNDDDDWSSYTYRFTAFGCRAGIVAKAKLFPRAQIVIDDENLCVHVCKQEKHNECLLTKEKLCSLERLRPNLYDFNLPDPWA
jgi:hypothetical protein